MMNLNETEIQQTLKLLKEDAGRVFDGCGLECSDLADSSVIYTAQMLARRIEAHLSDRSSNQDVVEINTLNTDGRIHSPAQEPESRNTAGSLTNFAYGLRTEMVQSTAEELNTGLVSPWRVSFYIDLPIAPQI